MAPPPGSVIATDVEDWHTTAACPSVSPGMAATSMGQYVTTFQADNVISRISSVADRDRTMVQTRSRSEIRGRMPTKTAATTTTAIPAWSHLDSRDLDVGIGQG
jgi:hypothetical protein